MSTDATRPCKYCGKKLPVEASFCMACGRSQDEQASPPTEPEAPSTSQPFALVEADDKPAPPAEPAPPAAPARPAEGDRDSLELVDADVPQIELDQEPAAAPATTEPAEDEDDDSESGGRTVRMPLADVVAAWAEDAPESGAPAAQAPKIPLTSNPKFVILALVIVAVVAGVAMVLL